MQGPCRASGPGHPGLRATGPRWPQGEAESLLQTSAACTGRRHWGPWGAGGRPGRAASAHLSPASVGPVPVLAAKGPQQVSASRLPSRGQESCLPRTPGRAAGVQGGQDQERGPGRRPLPAESACPSLPSAAAPAGTPGTQHGDHTQHVPALLASSLDSHSAFPFFNNEPQRCSWASPVFW